MLKGARLLAGNGGSLDRKVVSVTVGEVSGIIELASSWPAKPRACVCAFSEAGSLTGNEALIPGELCRHRRARENRGHHRLERVPGRAQGTSGSRAQSPRPAYELTRRAASSRCPGLAAPPGQSALGSSVAAAQPLQSGVTSSRAGRLFTDVLVRERYGGTTARQEWS